jgi:hypothetical protein
VGFTDAMSVNVGETIGFKVKTDASDYRIEVYRLGYYGGNGARLVATVSPSVSLPQEQPECLSEPSSHLVDCGNWTASASWNVPSSAVSGVYFARLIRRDTGGASHMVFVVRDDTSRSDIVFQTADATWQAYNAYGGSALNNETAKVSYNRPVHISGPSSTSYFESEYRMVRWLEANGFSVAYVSAADVADNAALLQNHRALVIAGQNSFTSSEERSNIEAARDNGLNLAFFSGRNLLWKTRWEPGMDSSQPRRTLVCYRQSASQLSDAADVAAWTGLWRDLRPENALTGLLYMVDQGTQDQTIRVPAVQSRMRFWRDTAVAAQVVGETVRVGLGTLASGWDVDVENGFRPAGLVSVSQSTYATDAVFDGRGGYTHGTATHSAVLYRARSGALVFNAGTPRWSWAIDAGQPGITHAPDLELQQATVNLLADMGAQPATPFAAIRVASPSTDIVAPAAGVTLPLTVRYGKPTRITGAAVDSGPGVVSAVEVSIDNGQTWRRAEGAETWSFDWTPLSMTGSAAVLMRVVDDSGNLSDTSAVSFAVEGGPTLWDGELQPTVPQYNDPAPVVLGMKFRSDIAGYVRAIRFFKGLRNTGVHIGSLWTSDGRKLASVTFANESASGWQEAHFRTPVFIEANTTYVVSYLAPNGWYAADARFFNKSITSPPLRALADGEDGPNGVFTYDTGAFPDHSYSSTNYWVDVLFSTSDRRALNPEATNHVTLAWTASDSQDVAGYYIYRSQDPTGPYALVNSVPIPETTYIDADVIPGQTYTYYVTAANSLGFQSVYSNPTTVTIP